MSRYIDAKWLQESLELADECKDCKRNVDKCVHNTIDVGVVCTAVDEAPSIDIVRCKECNHGTYCEEADMYICNANDQDLYEAGHFCSYGEREVEL